MKDRASIHAAATSSANTNHGAPFSQAILGSSARAFRDEALLSPLISTGRNGLGGHQSVRSPGALRLHPAFNELNLADWLCTADPALSVASFYERSRHWHLGSRSN